MDEVHNLVRPSDEILSNPKRLNMIKQLREMLRRAENSVIIGFTGTPLCDAPEQRDALKNIIKGREAANLSDEGFVSFYMATAPSVFPRVWPVGVPGAVPAEMVRSVPLRNMAREGPKSHYKQQCNTKGHKLACLEKVHTELLLRFTDGRPLTPTWRNMSSLTEAAINRLARYCTIGQGGTYAGQEKVAHVVNGGCGRLLLRDFDQVPFGSKQQRRRAQGYASKLQAIVRDVQRAGQGQGKTLIMAHRVPGYKLLLRMLAKALPPGAVMGYPPARTYSEQKDESMLALLGMPHDETRPERCKCALCSFNKGSAGAPRVLIADSKECGEGVSFLGVRKLLLVDVPLNAVEYLQRVGRAVRFMGHSSLPVAERQVSVRIYQATLPRKAAESQLKPADATADELLVERLRKNAREYKAQLDSMRATAVDADAWLEEEEALPAEEPAAAGASGSTGGSAGGSTGTAAADSGEESMATEDEPDEPQEEAAQQQPPPKQPKKKRRKTGTPPPPQQNRWAPPPPRGAHWGAPPPPKPQPKPPPKPAGPPPPAQGPTHDLPAPLAIDRILRAAYAMHGYNLPHTRLMDMLGLPLATSLTGELPRKAWKRLCLKIHPDKCREPRAEEAFKAMDGLYKSVIPQV